MRSFVRSIVFGALVLAIVLAGLAYTGKYNVGADDTHWPVTESILAWTRDASIAAHVADVVPPSKLDAPDRVRRGAGNYAAMCAGCHLAPGETTSELRRGLYPQPPDLTQASAGTPFFEQAVRRFWIIKHGIKDSGMPAWSKAGVDDAAIWDLVALVQQLPTLSAADYSTLVESSEGHSHDGADAAHHHHDDAD